MANETDDRFKLGDIFTLTPTHPREPQSKWEAETMKPRQYKVISTGDVVTIQSARKRIEAKDE